MHVLRIGANAVQFPVLLFFLLLQITVANAQNPSPILQTGNAAVAGFSGAKTLDGPQPPGAQPFDKTFIDLDGPALRVIDLSQMGGPPEAQLGDARRCAAAEHLRRGDIRLWLAHRRPR
jgi:hypothetical protein